MNLKTASAKRLHDVVIAEVMTEITVDNWPGIRMLEAPTPAPVNAPK